MDTKELIEYNNRVWAKATSTKMEVDKPNFN